ncbi:MAG: MATE family efflux transporter [Clostridia bacterium]|nr:MATE family efflux transporter [Clostridia bacterium]
MNIQLSDHFNYKKLLRYTLPSIAMMIFTSVYGVVDGFFVSNFVGKTPFAAVNFIYPFLMILGSVGFMFGAGGSALVSKTMGEGDKEKANRQFSLLVYATILVGVLLAAIGIVSIRRVAILLGAEGAMIEDCVVYGRIILFALPAFMLQFEFQSFFSTAEKPQLGLYVTIAAGVTNMVLDAVFIAVFRWGVIGAAAATALSQVVGGVLPLFYFARKNSSSLQLGKTKFDGRALWQTSFNGFSELVSNISSAVVGMVYNAQLMKYAGENGVAAYGVLMYVSFIFFAAYIGYSIGTAPVVGYHYGAENQRELKNVFRKSLVIIMCFSVVMVLLSLGLSYPLAKLYVGYDQELVDLTVRAFTIFSFGFLFSGFGIYSSSFFTALNNGLISAIISFLRTLVFQVGAILLLPLWFDVDGIWYSIIVAEVLSTIVSVVCLFAFQKKYQY